MVEITETDDSKVNSHHRYTGAVRVDFPRGEETVDVDEETARTAVNTYETVEFADDVDGEGEGEGEAEAEAETVDAQAGKKADTRTHQAAASDDTDTAEDADARESRAPHAQSDEADANEAAREQPGHEAP